MSGGYFDYKQHYIQDIIDVVEHAVKNKSLSEETLLEVETGLQELKSAFIYAQRIDLLLSGDDSEETFHRRLKEDFHAFR